MNPVEWLLVGAAWGIWNGPWAGVRDQPLLFAVATILANYDRG